MEGRMRVLPFFISSDTLRCSDCDEGYSVLSVGRLQALLQALVCGIAISGLHKCLQCAVAGGLISCRCSERKCSLMGCL